MFTTGSKLFLGATAVALLGAVVFGALTGTATGWTATVGLVAACVALAFLAAVNFYVRDANVGALQPDATTRSSAAREPVGRSMWPAIGAVGAGLVVVGMVTEPVVFLAGAVVLLATLLEWMVQGWSERASADRTYNEDLRRRLLHPLEFPVLAAVGVAVVVYSFSRIMLFVTKEGAVAVFAIVASLLLLGGFLFAARPSLKRGVVAGVCTVAALGLVSTGAVMAIDGERDIHVHEVIATSPGACLANEEAEVDEHASQTIGATANLAATIVFDGTRLYATGVGLLGEQTTITLARSAPHYVMFRNESDQRVRLTANLGAFPTATIVDDQPVLESPVTCTPLVGEGGRAFMNLIFSKPSAASEQPYTLTVPGVEAAVVEVVVP